MIEKHFTTDKLICPECGEVIEFTGDSNYNCGGELYYIGKCKGCETQFNIYEQDDDYELWYSVLAPYTVEVGVKGKGILRDSYPDMNEYEDEQDAREKYKELKEKLKNTDKYVVMHKLVENVPYMYEEVESTELD